MSNQDDKTFVRNFSLVLAGLVVVGLIAHLLAGIIGENFQATQNRTDAIAPRIAPVGQVNTGDEPVAIAGRGDAGAPAADAAAPATADAGADPGKATYDKACFACHAQGIAGAPKYGDMAAWEPRLAQGPDVLVDHALHGYTGQTGMMPAKGGNPTLSDADVAAAVDYMMAAVGAGSAAAPAPAAPAEGETAAPAADEATAPADAPSAEAAAEGDAAAVAAADGKGQEVYDKACFVCHTPGVAGAPKLGDKAAWEPRIAKGTDALYHSAINGLMTATGMMPPKGGRPDFSDEEVKAAVDYMVSNAK
jgi:cytochrome c5